MKTSLAAAVDQARVKSVDVPEAAVEAAEASYQKAAENPVTKPCPRCGGDGFHHGIAGWCVHCDGVGTVEADPLTPIRAALKAALPHLHPDKAQGERGISAEVVEFAKWVIRTSCWEGCDLEGGSVQDQAVALGLLREEPYDPELHGPNESVADAEPGDPWFVFSTLLSGTASPDGRADGWRPIESAPHETDVLLYTPATEHTSAKYEAGWASGGRVVGGYSNRWLHGHATHWHRLPAAPENRT